MIVTPRFAYRLWNRKVYNVAGLQGSSAFEHVAGKVTHYGLYAFMTIMPASGIAMGYYGGKGLPFFFTTISGAKEKNGGIAKNVSRKHALFVELAIDVCWSLCLVTLLVARRICTWDLTLLYHISLPLTHTHIIITTIISPSLYTSSLELMENT